MSVTLNTQLEELMFSSQIIYTWRRLRHQSKLYGVRLAQVLPTSLSINGKGQNNSNSISCVARKRYLCTFE